MTGAISGRRKQEESFPFPKDPSLRLILENTKAGQVNNDELFDRIYPEDIRRLSAIHWTPVQVARRAASLLSEGRPETRVLDVGSGIGKFCLVGALCTSAEFSGVEQRPHFVELSTRIIEHYRIPRVRFLHANFSRIDWATYNGVYLFNPFQENLPQSSPIDSTVRTHESIYRHYVRLTEEKLQAMPVGTRVVTYWGFGGSFPPGFSCKVNEFCYRGRLLLWVREW